MHTAGIMIGIFVIGYSVRGLVDQHLSLRLRRLIQWLLFAVMVALTLVHLVA
jgi:hypothetical protein